MDSPPTSRVGLYVVIAVLVLAALLGMVWFLMGMEPVAMTG